MTGRYWLGRLGNDELLAAVQTLVRQDNELTADLLAHLAELDERKLFLDLGFPSLFAYCTESLGLSESSAGRRITAARVGKRFPQVLALVARGELNLSILCALNPYLNHENAAELFAACSRKKRQQVEELLAARFPKPDVREAIRKLPVRVAVESTPSVAAAPVIDGVQPNTHTMSISTIAPILRRSEAHPRPIPATPPSPPQSAKARIEPLSVDRYGVHFTADGEFRDLLDAAQALASHRLPAGNMAELMKLALRVFIRETEKRRFAVGRKPRAARADAESPALDHGLLSPVECRDDAGATARRVEATPVVLGPRRVEATPVVVGPQRTKISRYIPAAVAREVYVRDKGRCSFVSADGRRCNARVRLEVDHAQPFAVGGAATASNLRLRCQAHNQLHARRYFGRNHVAAAIKQRREAARGDGDSGRLAGAVSARPPRSRCVGSSDVHIQGLRRAMSLPAAGTRLSARCVAGSRPPTLARANAAHLEGSAGAQPDTGDTMNRCNFRGVFLVTLLAVPVFAGACSNSAATSQASAGAAGHAEPAPGGASSGGSAGATAGASGSSVVAAGAGGASGGQAGDGAGGVTVGGTGGGAGAAGAEAGGTAGAAGGTGCKGAAVCYDFEECAIPAGWTVPKFPDGEGNIGAGTLLVDKEKAHGGMCALHMKDYSGNQPQHALLADLPANFGPILWGRAWVFNTATPTSHGALIKTRYTVPNSTDVDWYEVGYESHNYKGIWHNPLPPSGLPEWELPSPLKVVVGAWTCVEWLFDSQNAGQPEAADPRIWQDGVEAIWGKGDQYDLTNGKTNPRPPTPKGSNFVGIEVGLTMYHQIDQVTNIYVDDLAFGKQRIGCTP